MRLHILTACLLLSGCVAEAPHDAREARIAAIEAPATGAERLPEALWELRLVEDHPSISPVAFPHAQHLDVDRMGGEVACAQCHHELQDDPAVVPQRCTSCHEFAYLMPEVDESQPHEHELPPDL